MTLAKVSSREEHKERGDPAKIIKLNKKQKCKSCGARIEEGDFASLSLVNYRFYCDKRQCEPPIGEKRAQGEEKRSTSFEVRYVSNRSKDEVVEEIRETYQDEGFDMPDEDELEHMAEKRMQQDKSEASAFEEAAQPLDSL